MSELLEIPLFPLKVVLFPGGKLDLQIFERRYIDLISSCMRSDSGFGVCLLKAGDEVVHGGVHGGGDKEARQTIHRTGTYARIVDWNQLDNGLLGITVSGFDKFRVEDCWQSDSGVLQAKVRFSDSDSVNANAMPVDDEYQPLVELLENLERHPLVTEKKLVIDHSDLRAVGWRLSELLPIENEQRQDLLEIDDPDQRIEELERLVSDMANEV